MPETLGTRLRQERERRQIALASIAENTKISAFLLEGLERDDVSRWPTGIFRRSFVRSYALALGLDPEPIVKEFVELYPDPHELPPVTEQTDAESANFLNRGAINVQLTIVNAGTMFSRGTLLAGLKRRGAAAACDAALSCAIALGLSWVFGHFWTPLGVSMLCYYCAGTVLLGNTPGVCLFASDNTEVKDRAGE